MAEKKQADYSSFEKYMYGALAGRMLAAGNEGYAESSLEILAGKKGLNLGEEALKFHEAFGEQTKEQIANAVNT
ncbi:MAG: hypothetical protein WD876_00100, partial [Candidatus Pacearchaeota archaeon]